MTEDIDINTLTRKVEDFLIHKINQHNYFDKLSYNNKAIWAIDNLVPGDIYVFDRLGVALNGHKSGWLYDCHGEIVSFDQNDETLHFLYLGVESSALTKFNNCLTFFHDNAKYHINVVSALCFKRLKTEQ